MAFHGNCPAQAYQQYYTMQETGRSDTMRTMLDVLLELGGDLSRVNIVGNDFLAVARLGSCTSVRGAFRQTAVGCYS